VRATNVILASALVLLLVAACVEDNRSEVEKFWDNYRRVPTSVATHRFPTPTSGPESTPSPSSNVSERPSISGDAKATQTPPSPTAESTPTPLPEVSRRRGSSDSAATRTPPSPTPQPTPVPTVPGYLKDGISHTLANTAISSVRSYFLATIDYHAGLCAELLQLNPDSECDVERHLEQANEVVHIYNTGTFVVTGGSPSRVSVSVAYRGKLAPWNSVEQFTVYINEPGTCCPGSKPVEFKHGVSRFTVFGQTLFFPAMSKKEFPWLQFN
jgi:hypothetical protein